VAAIIILQLKRSPKVVEFIANIEPQLQNYGFEKINEMPLIYFSEKVSTTELNKVLRLMRSNPDYRSCVQKCFNNILRIV